MLMRAKRCFALLPTLVMLSTAACDGSEAPGYYYEVTVTGSDNNCTTDDATTYSETFEYRLERIGTGDVVVHVGDAVLGTGVLDGCGISYRSTLFTDTRDSQTIRWALTGNAEIALGSSGACASGDGWLGTEAIEISSSTDPTIMAGCVYELDVAGTFLREVL
jgi:hypothetical protein